LEKDVSRVTVEGSAGEEEEDDDERPRQSAGTAAKCRAAPQRAKREAAVRSMVVDAKREGKMW
jgi:hypothetical protein